MFQNFISYRTVKETLIEALEGGAFTLDDVCFCTIVKTYVDEWLVLQALKALSVASRVLMPMPAEDILKDMLTTRADRLQACQVLARHNNFLDEFEYSVAMCLGDPYHFE